MSQPVQAFFWGDADDHNDNDGAVVMLSSERSWHRPPHRNFFYITSVVLKIASVLAGVVCLTLVACMVNDEMDDAFGPASEHFGAFTLLLDFVVVPFMAAAGSIASAVASNRNVNNSIDNDDNNARSSVQKAGWLRTASWILYAIVSVAGLVLLIVDIDVTAGMIGGYMVGAALSWTLMLLFAEVQ